jgi:hypothetical protein
LSPVVIGGEEDVWKRTVPRKMKRTAVAAAARRFLPARAVTQRKKRKTAAAAALQVVGKDGNQAPRAIPRPKKSAGIARGRRPFI